jgi:hypothetical protein
VERLTLTIRQHVAAVGRRGRTLCKSEDGVRQPLGLSRVSSHGCLPHAALRQALPQSVPSKGPGSATQWRPGTPARAAGLTDRVGTWRAVVGGRGTVRRPAQTTGVRTADVEGVTRGARATRMPRWPSHLSLFALRTVAR